MRLAFVYWITLNVLGSVCHWFKFDISWKASHTIRVQVGRAGRDMKTRAFCHTFLADDDWLRFRALLHSDAVDRTTICGIVQVNVIHAA